MEVRARVSIVLDHVPDPVDRGEKFRTRKILEALVAHYDVGVVCLERRGDRPAAELAQQLGFRVEWSRRISRRREILVRMLGMATPLPCRHFFQKQVGLHAAMLKAASGSELVLLENPYAYVDRLRQFRVVNDLHGIESEYYRSLAETVRDTHRRVYYRWEHRKLLRHEAAVWNGAAGNIFLAEHDEQCARRLGFRGDVASTIISQGIDFPDMEPQGSDSGCESDLFFCGNLTQPRNVDPLVTFIELIRSGIRKGEIPGSFKFRIAGKGAPARLLELCDGNHFEYLGFLPSLDAHLRSTRAIFCYLPGGSGVKTKIVEAFGFGKSVICDSLSAKALPDLFVRSGAKPAESFPEAYEYLRQILGGNALGTDIRAHVRDQYSWRGLMGRFVAFLESVRSLDRGTSVRLGR
jgi:glycosyltransferase involved in cell wall biosynthesis